MWAVAIALAAMMWMWAAAGLHLSGWLERGANHTVRMAYFAVVVALGATAILAVLWLALPGSVLTQAWTLKQLRDAQQLSALLVLLMAMASVWRAYLLLLPAQPVPASATAKAAQKKRRL